MFLIGEKKLYLQLKKQLSKVSFIDPIFQNNRKIIKKLDKKNNLFQIIFSISSMLFLRKIGLAKSLSNSSFVVINRVLSIASVKQQ